MARKRVARFIRPDGLIVDIYDPNVLQEILIGMHTEERIKELERRIEKLEELAKKLINSGKCNDGGAP